MLHCQTLHPRTGKHQRRLCTQTFWPEIRARNVCEMQLKVAIDIVKLFKMKQLQAASSGFSVIDFEASSDRAELAIPYQLLIFT